MPGFLLAFSVFCHGFGKAVFCQSFSRSGFYRKWKKTGQGTPRTGGGWLSEPMRGNAVLMERGESTCDCRVQWGDVQWGMCSGRFRRFALLASCQGNGGAASACQACCCERVNVLLHVLRGVVTSFKIGGVCSEHGFIFP